jgi:hypothetical protein
MFVSHPLAINALAAAATTAGAAAARRDQQKRAMYSRVKPNGYPFVPFSVESYGNSLMTYQSMLWERGRPGQKKT